MTMMRNIGLVAFGVATVPIAAAAYFIHRDMTATPAEQTPTGHYGGYAVGDQRFEMLTKLTRVYVSRHTDASAAIRNGKELAPAVFLNQELSLEGAKWRVRSVDGLVADIYNVS